MSGNVTLFAGDTFPSRLTYKVAGVAVDITGYAFTLTIGYSAPLVKQAIILDQATNVGQFEFRWASGDLRPGKHACQIVTTYPDGTVKTDQLPALDIQRRL